MSIAELREQMLLPEREILINKPLTIRGFRALIAAITLQKDIVKLWVFQHCPCPPPEDIRDDIDDEYDAPRTNRDELMTRWENDHHTHHHFAVITIQGQRLPLASSSMGSIGHNLTSYMMLQHFIEAGVDFSSIEDIDLDDLALGQYELEEDSPFPAIDPAGAMPVSIRFGDEHREEAVEPASVLTLAMGEQPDTCHTFHDPETGRDITFYLNRLECHDLWKEQAEKKDDTDLRAAWKQHGMDDEQIADMLRQHEEALEQACPRDCGLLLLQYEAEEDVQLCFHTTEFLDSVPIVQEGSVGIIFGVGTDDERNVHGHRLQVCNLGTVPMGYNRETQLELLSWYRKIPGEQIEV